MKKLKNKFAAAYWTERMARADAVRERLYRASAQEEAELLRAYGVPREGLSAERAERARAAYGRNVVAYGRPETRLRRLAAAFLNPFTVILLILAAVSAVPDILAAGPGERNYATVLIIGIMVLLSGALRFIQETRSGNVAEKLIGMIRTTASVERAGVRRELPMEELVVGDLVFLAAGDRIPADVRILSAKDLLVSQSALTGESEAVEKLGAPLPQRGPLTDTANLAFLGSSVVSGSARAVVLAVGNDTMLGTMAKDLNAETPKTTFEQGIHAVSWVLIRFMLVMVPVVLFLNGFTGGDWVQTALFAVSVAVGLTPEMLPMIVTTSLAKGAVAMSRRKVIIKRLNAIQDLGAIDLLCTDKTGTLTRDQAALACCRNIDGEEDARVLRHAFLNSCFQTGLKNLLDAAVLSALEAPEAERLTGRYTMVDEIPFDFSRRRMSVVVRDPQGKTQLITKGAVEEMLACCRWAESGGEVRPLDGRLRRLAQDRAAELNEQGMRVIAVARKTEPASAGRFSAADETEMVLLGFLAFLDPPKETAREAIRAIQEYGVRVKILTGDNGTVTRAICRQVGLPADRVLLGPELERLNDRELGKLAERTTVFAKLSPEQKARVVRVLRENGHSVGYLGDGINDVAAMKAADVGISVDTAVDIAKETASVILLEKDLTVLQQAVVEGRKTHANTMKYIKITASSNFGNMVSVLVASAFLPFLPMVSVQLILLNLIYDVSCTAMSWDNVDAEELRAPRKWDAAGIRRFMLWIGPASSVFDIATYLLMYFVICPALTGGLLYTQLADPAMRALYAALFQTGWFVESMWSQTLVIHMLRTPKLPFVQSRASGPVALLTFAGIAAVTVLPFTPMGTALGLAVLPPAYFLWLTLLVAGYMALATLMKRAYIRRHGAFL